MTLDLPKLKAVAEAAENENTSKATSYDAQVAFHVYFDPPTVLAIIARIETAERWMARTILLLHTMVGDGVFFTEEEEPSDLWFEGMAILGLDPDFVDETKHRADLIARALLTPPAEGQS